MFYYYYYYYVTIFHNDIYIYVKIIITVILEIKNDNIQETPTLNNVANSEQNILDTSNNNVQIVRRFSAHYALFQVYFV